MAQIKPVRGSCLSLSNMMAPAVFALALCGAAPAWGQGEPSQSVPAYPVRPIRLIVPFTPAGGADSLARLFAPRLHAALGQPVIVENRPGASTIIGGDVVAKAPPDGHALFMGTFTNAVNPSLYPKAPWNINRDFVPVSLLATTSYTLAVHPSVPVKTPRQLVALAKAKPGELNFASAGMGAPSHLAGELLNMIAQVKLVHVPYKGSVPALTDVISGQVPITFGNNISTLPHVKSGRLRALGVTSATRLALMPDVPTMIEGGFPDFVVVGWFGILTTAGTPQSAVARLHTELARITRDADMQRRLAASGSEPVGSSPAEFAAFLHREIDKWAKVVRAAGLKAQ